MAEARGVPRGNYDGPVHDVISMTKSVPSTPTTRGPSCPKTQTGPRNLHQSGFTLAGSVHTSRTYTLVSAVFWSTTADWLSCILGKHCNLDSKQQLSIAVKYEEDDSLITDDDKIINITDSDLLLPLLQALRLTTTYLVVLLRGLWRPLVDDPTLHPYLKTRRIKLPLWVCPTKKLSPLLQYTDKSYCNLTNPTSVVL